MVYARTNSSRGSSNHRRSRRRTRRYSASAKVRFQAPTARHQRSQIARNTAAVDRLFRKTRRHMIYTDWHTRVETNPSWNTFFAYAMTDPSGVLGTTPAWDPVLRQDATVNESSHTFCKRLQINCRVNLGLIADTSVYWSCFIVRPRFSDTFAVAPAVINDDFIASAPGIGVRLNSAKWKVVASKYVTLSHNAVGQPGGSPVGAGNPLTTFKKWQWNVPLNFSIVNPAPVGVGTTNSWRKKTISDLPYYNRYYVLIYCSHAGAVPTGGLPYFSLDSLITCTNTD